MYTFIGYIFGFDATFELLSKINILIAQKTKKGTIGNFLFFFYCEFHRNISCSFYC